MNAAKIFLVLIVLNLLILPVLALKPVDLKAYGFDVDTEPEAFPVFPPGPHLITGTIINNLASEETDKTLDLVFVLDASGSMQGEINSVKNSIKQIINKINADAPGRMRVGIYILEGRGSTTGFIAKNSYCASNGDIGAIHLTDNGALLKTRLGQVSASCGTEPWAMLSSQVLNDNSFGWRPDAVPVVLAISDEPDNGCSGGVTAAINTVNAKDAWWFGIYSGSAQSNMQQVDAGTRGEIYYYSGTGQIAGKIMQAITTVLNADDFKVKYCKRRRNFNFQFACNPGN